MVCYNKILNEFCDTLIANDDLLFLDEDFSKVAFYANQMGILRLDFDKINLNNFLEDDPDTIIYVKILVWCNKFGKREVLKKKR